MKEAILKRSINILFQLSGILEKAKLETVEESVVARDWGQRG